MEIHPSAGRFVWRHQCALVLGALLAFGPTGVCAQESSVGPTSEPADFREAMRRLVVSIASYAREHRPGFVVIPQNGEELLTRDGEPDGPLATAYVAAIDGQGREDLFFGYERDGVPTERDETRWIAAFLDRARAAGVLPLVTDYVRNGSQALESARLNTARGYLSFAAPSRELDRVPAPPFVASGTDAPQFAGSRLEGISTFLYLINPGSFEQADDLVDALSPTSYDLLIIDPFVGRAPLEPAHIQRLRERSGQSNRLVIAYLSIGEAEEYRDYWRSEWRRDPPRFIARENPNWPGNYTVRYWDPRWQSIVFGGPDAALDRIIAAGFDGVYLDIIDAYEYFEADPGS